MAGEYFVPPRVRDEDESIASFVTRRFGGEALRRLGEPLLAGIHGGDAERLSMRALFPRFVDLERTDGSVIRGLRRLRGHTTAPPGGPFVSVRGGTEALVHALVASLPHAALISDVQVSTVEWRGGWRVHLKTGRHIDASAVLLATPPQAIADLVQHVDPALSGLLGRIRDVPLVTVALGYRRKDVRHPLAGSGFVVPKAEGASVNAVTWMSSKWMERAPADGVLLRASVGGARHPDVATWSSDDALRRVRQDLRRYLHISAAPAFARVYRMPHAGVQLETGHLNLIARAQARLDELRGLFISASGVRGVGIADCVSDARAQASAAAEYLRCKERHQPSDALQSRHAAHP